MIVWEAGRAEQKELYSRACLRLSLKLQACLRFLPRGQVPGSIPQTTERGGGSDVRDDSHLSSHVAQPARCHAGEMERSYSATYAFLGGDSAGLTSSGGEIYLQENEQISHKHSGVPEVLKRHRGMFAG